MPASLAQTLLNQPQASAKSDVKKPVAVSSPPEKEFKQVLKSQQKDTHNEPKPAQEASTEDKSVAANEVADARSAQAPEQDQNPSRDDSAETGQGQAEVVDAQPGFVALHYSLSGEVSQIDGDVGALLPDLGNNLPLTAAQLQGVQEQLAKLQPGQKLTLSLNDGKLNMDVLDASGKLVSKAQLPLTPKQTQDGLLGLQSGQVELGKSEADQLLGLMQKGKSATQLEFQQELKQLLGQAQEPTGSAVSSTSLSNANMSYRFVDGQLQASSQINTQVGKPGWSDQVNQQVAWFSSKNISVAEIKLDPPDLGPLHVKVSNNGDQTSITFTSTHAQVRDVLDQNLPRLREMLAEQGVDLADVDVGGEAQAEHENEQQALADNGSEEDAETDAATGELAAKDEAELQQVGQGLVDERV